MMRCFDGGSSGTRSRVKRGSRAANRHRARPALEGLERRLTPSVGGGWISSTQAGQSGDGLFGEYYDNPTLSGTPSFTRWDGRVDDPFPDGNAYPGGSPDPAFDSVGPDDWSARWAGTLAANFSEAYTFSVDSACGGVRLWVSPIGMPQAAPLIVDMAAHGRTTDSASLTLQAGQDYAVELEFTRASAASQQVQLQWSSPSTPLEDIEPITQVGLNVDGGDSLFANLVNGGSRPYWWAPGNTNQTVRTDSDLWPEADAEIFLGEGDADTAAGGSYLVQFQGMATVTNWPQAVDWVVDGADLHSGTLPAGRGYDPSSNTTTATMVVAPSTLSGFYLSFTNTSRVPSAPLDIAAIGEAGTTVTVAVPSVSGFASGQKVTIAGFGGRAAGYDGTFQITGVNPSNSTLTYTDSATQLPVNPAGGTARDVQGNGITGLYVMQPTAPGGNTPLAAGTLFAPAALSMFAQYTTLRLMDLDNTNTNLTSDFSDRTHVSENFWTAKAFNGGVGVDTGVNDGSAKSGVPWELQIALANETGKDVYINVPSNSSSDYLADLADLFAYGSDGVTPYTSAQEDPAWKPLDPGLKVYIEFSNETWNSSFAQAETRSDGWANQLGQRALYDYLTGDLDDPKYPGGGGDAYNDGAYLAAYYGVNGGDDAGFLGTYNPAPAPSGDGGSPAYFSNSASINGYSIGQGWIGLRDVQISDAFKAAFGEVGVNATDAGSRVRPVFEWQYGGNWSGALGFISGTFGARHPVGYYLYGGGGGWYAGNGVGGFGDVSFANPAFSDGLAGWSSSGSAGVAANGSALGNPNAPPLFSAIGDTDGATEAGSTVTITTATAHDFVVGQSVLVSRLAVQGYDGTFTVTSVTPTTFTYQASATGLASCGGGMVTGTGGSTQTAYLQPGASISQDVTFTGGYADLTFYATQNVPLDWSHGLSITLTPKDGGPAIDGGQPVPQSEGANRYSGDENAFVWDRTTAFYTGASDYTYTVTFTNTLASGTVFVDNAAIQTVNGMFNETTAAPQGAQLNISGEIRSDVDLALRYGLHDVGYEGGYYFDQNQSGYLDINGYRDMGGRGFSSGSPNVGMYANLDPRAERLAIQTLDEFYAAGGSLPVVYQSSGNINSWAVAAPNYSDWDTPKLQAAASVEQAAQPATYGLKPNQSGTDYYWWLVPGQFLDTTYLVPRGAYGLTMTFGAAPGNPSGQTAPVEVLVDGRVVATVGVPTKAGGTFTAPLGVLGAGQHSVELLDAAGPGGGNLALGPPGTPVDTLKSAATPSVTWAAPAVIAYGTALGASQLDATSSVPGTFTYTPGIGTVLGPGTHTLTVNFTPNDAADYTPATATTTIIVKGATSQRRVMLAGRHRRAVARIAAVTPGRPDGTSSAGGRFADEAFDDPSLIEAFEAAGIPTPPLPRSRRKASDGAAIPPA